MPLLDEGEVLKVSGRSLAIQTAIGAVFLAIGLWVLSIAGGRAESQFLWVWGSIWFLISSAFLIFGLWGLCVSRPRFARLGEDGLQLYRQHAPTVPWSQILEARLGPKKIEASRGTKFLFRHPLILRLRDRTGFPESGWLKRSYSMAPLPEGSLEWMIPLDGCPGDERDFLAKIQERLRTAQPSPRADTPILPVFGMERLDRPQKPSIVTPFFAILFVGYGLFFAWKGLDAYHRGLASLEWPVTKGTITESAFRRSKNDTKLTVTYPYTVEGRAYTGKRIAFASTSSDQTIWAARFKKNTVVDVHYNPSDPSECVLVVGQQNAALAILGFGLFFAAVAAWFVFMNFRARKRLKDWVKKSESPQTDEV